MLSKWSNCMNIHHVLSVSRWPLSMGSLILAFGLPQAASGADLSKFRRIEPQFIAALGDPAATSGNGAQSWGIWNQDPGPRACKLDHYPQLKATGVAPAQWKFDASDWWLEEHGFIMEKPTFPLAAGKYLVTGDRKVTTVLTVHPRTRMPISGGNSPTARPSTMSPISDAVPHATRRRRLPAGARLRTLPPRVFLSIRGRPCLP